MMKLLNYWTLLIIVITIYFICITIKFIKTKKMENSFNEFVKSVGNIIELFISGIIVGILLIILPVTFLILFNFNTTKYTEIYNLANIPSYSDTMIVFKHSEDTFDKNTTKKIKYATKDENDVIKIEKEIYLNSNVGFIEDNSNQIVIIKEKKNIIEADFLNFLIPKKLLSSFENKLDSMYTKQSNVIGYEIHITNDKIKTEY